jgi:hypothetical protein
MYKGDYKEGKKEGVGIFKHNIGAYEWIDGSKYTGQWENNKINGKVKILLK